MTAMLTTFAIYALPFSFTLLVACVLTTVVSGIVIFAMRLRQINLTLRHPYLDHQNWDRYPLGIKLAILLDYFFRLAFPNSTFWLIGHANRILRHVKPDDVSVHVKWPLFGFWGGCFVGIIAMLLVWLFAFLTTLG